MQDDVSSTGTIDSLTISISTDMVEGGIDLELLYRTLDGWGTFVNIAYATTERKKLIYRPSQLRTYGYSYKIIEIRKGSIVALLEQVMNDPILGPIAAGGIIKGFGSSAPYCWKYLRQLFAELIKTKATSSSREDRIDRMVEFFHQAGLGLIDREDVRQYIETADQSLLDATAAMESWDDKDNISLSSRRIGQDIRVHQADRAAIIHALPDVGDGIEGEEYEVEVLVKRLNTDSGSAGIEFLGEIPSILDVEHGRNYNAWILDEKLSEPENLYSWSVFKKRSIVVRLSRAERGRFKKPMFYVQGVAGEGHQAYMF